MSRVSGCHSVFFNSIGKLASVLKKFPHFNYIFEKVFRFFESEKLDLFLSRNEIKYD